jgi:phage anti-repressor protein
MEFTPENVFALVSSKEEFPVDFDDAWQWIGYTRKSAAKEALLIAGFLEGIDFRFLQNTLQKSMRGRPSEKIFLTVDCFKSFAMMAGTEHGKEVRKYFLCCEADLKRRIEEDQRCERDRVLRAVVSENYSRWEKRYENHFFDEAYRITGWERPERGHPPCMGKFINENVYDRFPEGTTAKLQHVNPKNSSGRRFRKHHQHLTQNVGLPILGYQKGITIAVMRLSPDGNPKRFSHNMNKACGGPIQIELPFMDEEVS